MKTRRIKGLPQAGEDRHSNSRILEWILEPFRKNSNGKSGKISTSPVSLIVFYLLQLIRNVNFLDVTTVPSSGKVLALQEGE